MKTNNLKKQEEKTFFNGGDICDTCGQKMKDIGNGGYTHNCHTLQVATKEGRKDFTYSVMPSKVATSEKDLECKYYNKCPLKVRGEKCTHHDGGNISMNDGATSEKEVKYSDKTCECKGLENLHFEGQCQFYTSKKKKYAACDNLEAHIPDYNPKNYVPPHESEDWTKEVLSRYNAEILNQFQDKYLMERGPGCEEILFPVLTKALEDFINPPNGGMVRRFNLEDFKKSVSSKAYQRGREELREKAVQEIEKEKRKITICSEEDYKNGTSCNNCESGLSECTNASKDKEHNQGLDKAKSIISGVMKE